MAGNANRIGKNANPIRWDDLRLLLALVREGSLSGAGQRLGVNTSTVARRLDALEAGLGRHLFDRTPAGIVPSDLAEALTPVAESMERAAVDAVRLVENRETAPEGVVRVTAPPGLTTWMVAPALVEFHRRYPKVVIELVSSVGYADLTRREADIALRSLRPKSGDLVAQKLAETTLIPVASPPVCARVGTLDELGSVPWIVWGADLSHLPDAQWVEAHVPSASIVLRTSSMDAQLHAARAGLGALLVPEPFVAWTGLQPLRLARKLSARLAAYPRGSLWIVGHRALRNVPRIQAVWDFMVELAASTV